MNPMPSAECRASMGLALIFVLRMLKTALPGLVSRHASTPVRSTTQSLGPVRRGAAGGLLAHIASGSMLFVSSAPLTLSQLLLSRRMAVSNPCVNRCALTHAQAPVIDATDSRIYTQRSFHTVFS
ncbi:MAG: hypothetical protein KBD77_03965 [Brachymonas sp.]|nr:hypothetical protein [Brachymonas sp.]